MEYNQNLSPYYDGEKNLNYMVSKGVTKLVAWNNAPPNQAYWDLFGEFLHCLLYTSDAADEEDSVDLGGRRIIKKKKKKKKSEVEKETNKVRIRIRERRICIENREKTYR
eukprot:TRINITY_DN6770_c0_g1_i7.p1 TRINITY_DN6770_c0_g1~~TRINITY_DN6770_c0_g1_i7.p1  ORF type:complete len:110 (+),score=22.34 TRINITY_DN6770_c0_g1_i7:242-571(+)